ncbi:MAG: glycosyltransferase family 4 protein [Rickettsiales bacterium]
MVSNTKKYHKGTVLQVLPELYTGGVERGTVDLSKELVNQNYKSLVASSGGVLVSSIKNQGGHHINLPLKSKNPISMFRNIKRIKKIISKYNVDIVHARSRAPAWSAYFACKKTNTPFVTTFHGFYKFSNLFKKWYNSVMTRGFVVVAVSEFIKEHIIEKYGVPVDHIKVIHRGVDLDYFNPKKVSFQRLNTVSSELNIPEDKTMICMPGRISSWKGQDVLIQALSKIKSKNFHCMFVGDYSKKPKYHLHLINLIEKNNLSHSVTFAGNVKDMAAIYKLSDIIVSASREPEAFGRVATEGQAMQKIVIASNIGGSKETIKDKKTGFLFKVNDPEDLTNKIDLVCSMEDQEREKFGVSARNHIQKNFSLKQMYRKTLDLYQDIIETNQ